jgi:hypothetical protein
MLIIYPISASFEILANLLPQKAHLLLLAPASKALQFFLGFLNSELLHARRFSPDLNFLVYRCELSLKF